MAKVTVRRNFRPLASIQFTDRALMERVGSFVVRQVRTRTESGRGVDGRFFQALSPAYAKQKQHAVGSTRADLTLSGAMLNDLTVTKVTAKTVTVGFLS